MCKVYDLQTQHKITPIEYEQIFSTVLIRPYLKDCNDSWNEIGDRTRKLLDMIGTTDYQDILQWKNQKFDLGDRFFRKFILDSTLELKRRYLDECTKNIENYLHSFGDIKKIIEERSQDHHFVIN